MGGGPNDVDPSRPELDEEQNVESLEPDRLHRKEVAGQDPVRLSSQELRPGRTGTPRCRAEAVRSEQPPDRRGAGSDPKPAELARDPDAAPPGVLPGEPQDQVADLCVDPVGARTCPFAGTSTSCARALGARGAASEASRGTPPTGPSEGPCSRPRARHGRRESASGGRLCAGAP